MDLQQRFIEASRFDIDDWFAEKILSLSQRSRFELISDIASVVEYLPISNGWSQEVYGVILRDNKFYVLEYLKQETELPLIVDIDFVECDEYLDAILDNKTIKSYTNVKRTYHTNTTDSSTEVS
jgi:hypothetical protein